MPNPTETWLDEQQVNTAAGGIQSDPAIIQLENGNTVITWMDGTSEVKARIYDLLGNPLTGEITVKGLTFNQTFALPKPVAGDGGGFVVGYVYKQASGGANGAVTSGTNTTTGDGIVLQRFDATGAKVGSELVLAASGDLVAFDIGEKTSNGFAVAAWIETSGTSRTLNVVQFNPDTMQTTIATTLSLPASATIEDLEVDLGSFDDTIITYAYETTTGGNFIDRVLHDGATNMLALNATLVAGAASVQQDAEFVTDAASGTYILMAHITSSNVLLVDYASYVDTSGAAAFLTLGGDAYDLVYDGASGALVTYRDATDGSLNIANAANTAAITTMPVGEDFEAIRLKDGRIQVVWESASGEVYTEIIDPRTGTGNPVNYDGTWAQVGTIGNNSGVVGILTDVFYAWDGNDDLAENTGSNITGRLFDLGRGNDSFAVRATVVAGNTYLGGEGSDTLDLSFLINVDVDTNAGTFAWSGLAGTSDIDGFETYLLTGGADVFAGDATDETVTAGSGDDSLSGAGGADSLSGGNGNDTLEGGNGSDTLDGGDLDDFMVGDGGFDSLLGGLGKDTLLGGTADDTLFGGNGNDLLNGGNNADLAYGGNQDDKVFGGNGIDTLYGDAGNDTLIGGKAVESDILYGGSGSDILLGQEGEDTLYGGGDNDRLSGGSQSDRLEGEDGADTLIGGGGLDTLIGGAGDDELTGSAQADLFVFEDGWGADTITDFAAGVGAEKVNLANVGAITDYADLVANHLSEVNGNAVITDGLGNSITLTGVAEASLIAADFDFTAPPAASAQQLGEAWLAAEAAGSAAPDGPAALPPAGPDATEPGAGFTADWAGAFLDDSPWADTHLA